jgi:hypothetical protein
MLLSSGATPAYAGWTPDPTTPTPAALTAATRACDWQINGNRPPVLNGKPVLTDARGRYTAQLYVTKNDVRFCISPGHHTGTESGSSPGLLWFYAAPGPDQLGLSDNGGGSARGFGTSNPNEDDFVRHAFGLAGRNVRAVSFRFAGGSVVRATVEHGWYFAWWPNMNYPASVAVTTTSGTIRSPMEPTGGQGRGCRFGGRGCVWAGVRRHPDPPRVKLVPLAQAGWSAAPRSAMPVELADARTACRRSTKLTANSWARTVIDRRPVLIEQRGRYVAELWLGAHNPAVCISDGRATSLASGFDHGLVLPSGAKISRPQYGNAPARGFPGREQIESHLFGRSATDVKTVTLVFGGGMTVQATVEHGWYFAWWPQATMPEAITAKTPVKTMTVRLG